MLRASLSLPLFFLLWQRQVRVFEMDPNLFDDLLCVPVVASLIRKPSFHSVLTIASTMLHRKNTCGIGLSTCICSRNLSLSIIGIKSQGRVPADIRVGSHAATRRWHAGLHNSRRRSGHGHTGAIRRDHECVLKAAPCLRQQSPQKCCGTRHRERGTDKRSCVNVQSQWVTVAIAPSLWTFRTSVLRPRLQLHDRKTGSVACGAARIETCLVCLEKLLVVLLGSRLGDGYTGGAAVLTVSRRFREDDACWEREGMATCVVVVYVL